MPIFLVSSSQRVNYQEYIEADNEDLARIDAMKRNRKVPIVGWYGYGVDSVEEAEEGEEELSKHTLVSKAGRELVWELVKELGK